MALTFINNSVHGTRVNTSYADRFYSAERQDENYMQCVQRDAYDMTGRQACVDSLSTKREGCNSATDRIEVENFLRPFYSGYVGLDVYTGVKSDLSGPLPGAVSYGQMVNQQMASRTPSYDSVLQGKISPQNNIMADFARASQQTRLVNMNNLSYGDQQYASLAGM